MDEEVKDILWSKDIEDMKNSWIDKGFSEEDAQLIADNMNKVEQGIMKPRYNGKEVKGMKLISDGKEVARYEL